MPAPLHFPRLSSLSALASLFYFVWGELTRLSSSSSSLLCFLIFLCSFFVQLLQLQLSFPRPQPKTRPATLAVSPVSLSSTAISKESPRPHAHSRSFEIYAGFDTSKKRGNACEKGPLLESAPPPESDKYGTAATQTTLPVTDEFDIGLDLSKNFPAGYRRSSAETRSNGSTPNHLDRIFTICQRSPAESFLPYLQLP